MSRAHLRALLVSGAILVVLLSPGTATGQTPPGGRQRIEQMTPQQREQLFRKQQRFNALPPAQREQLLQFHRQLMDQPDRPQLEAVMQQYHEWLGTLSPLQREELLKLPPRQRLAQIGQLREEQLRESAFKRLAPSDREAIVGFLRQRIERGAWFEPAWLDAWERHRGPPPPEILAQPNDAPRPPRPGSRPSGRVPDREFFAELRTLSENLSPEAQARLRAPGAARGQLLRIWFREAMRELAPQDAELERFFSDQLTNDQRERLLSLAPEEMHQELARLYVQKQRRTQRDDGPRGPRPGRPPGPPGLRGPNPRGPGAPRGERPGPGGPGRPGVGDPARPQS